MPYHACVSPRRAEKRHRQLILLPRGHPLVGGEELGEFSLDETAWDSPYREHGTLLRSAVRVWNPHAMATSRTRASSLLAVPWLAPPVPSKQIGAEQLPSIGGTFERSMPGSALLPRPSASSSGLHGGFHEQSWSPGGVALGRDLHGSDASGSAILPANASARLRERAPIESV